MILSLNTGPIGFLESLPHLLREFDCLPLAVLIQEAHLPYASLPKARAMVHRLLPAYYLFAGRPQRGDDSSAAAQIQVVTLVHVYMAARASLLNIQTQYEDVADRAPGALRQVHFIKMSDPSSDTTLLIGNIYQAQAAEPGRQEAILELARRVIIRWADQADLVVVGGDWNASTRPRVGYVGSQVTR